MTNNSLTTPGIPENENLYPKTMDAYVFDSLSYYQNADVIPIANEPLNTLEIDTLDKFDLYISSTFLNEYSRNRRSPSPTLKEYLITAESNNISIPQLFIPYTASVIHLAAIYGYPSVFYYFYKNAGTPYEYAALNTFSPAKLFQLGRYLSFTGLYQWEIKRSFIYDTLNNNTLMAYEKMTQIADAYYGFIRPNEGKVSKSLLAYSHGKFFPALRIARMLPLYGINTETLNLMNNFIQDDYSLTDSWSLDQPIPYDKIGERIDSIYCGQISGEEIMKFSRSMDTSEIA